MYSRAESRQREKEWNKKYGNMTDKECEKVVLSSISHKFDEARAKVEQRQAERDAKYNLPYSGIVKAVEKSSKQMKAPENKPEELRNAMRSKLDKEFDTMVENGMFDKHDTSSRELFISKKLVDYMGDSTGEYYKAKKELQQARTDYAIYLSKKAEWEEENASIIEAERIRARRAELLQAGPEALRALGINPDVVEAPHYRGKNATPLNGETEEVNALRAMEIDIDALFAIHKIRNAGVSLEE